MFSQGRPNERLPGLPDKVIDLTLVNDEVSLLEFRLEYLGPHVDQHVVVSADVTHGGQPKAFLEPATLVGKSVSPISLLHLKVPEAILRLGDRWAIEEFSRAWLLDFSRKSFKGNPVFLLCDIDEIPSREQVQEIRASRHFFPVKSIPMFTSYFSVNLLDYGGRPNWVKAKAVSWRSNNPAPRFAYAPKIRANPGQHLRYLNFTHTQFSKKLEDFAHSELDRGQEFKESLFKDAFENGLRPVPELESSPLGLLAIANASELSEVARSYLLKDPDCLSSPENFPSISRRVSRAKRLMNGRFRQAEGLSGDTRFRWPKEESELGRLFARGRRVMTRLSKELGQRPPGRSWLHVAMGVNHYGGWKNNPPVTDFSRHDVAPR